MKYQRAVNYSVYLVFIVILVYGMATGGLDKQESKNFECALKLEADVTDFYLNHKYWEDDGLCCKYGLIDYNVEEVCYG